MKQLPITTAEIHVIPVPADTHRFELSKCLTGTAEREVGHHAILWMQKDSYTSGYSTFYSPNNEYELLGTCTEDDIDFDAAPIFENAGGMLNNKYALRSAIKSAGYYFVNPMGTNDDTGHNARDREWQAAQQSIVEKLGIIKKV